MATVREWVHDWSGVLGRRARDPLFAGKLVAASAAVFTSVWLVVVSAADFGPSVASPPPSSSLVWLGLIAGNAFVVTALFWRRFVATAPRFGPARAAAVGLAVGLVSYPTFCALLFVSGALLEGSPSMLLELGTLSQVVVLGSMIGVGVTLAVPVALSVAVALALSACERRAVENESASRTTHSC